MQYLPRLAGIALGAALLAAIAVLSSGPPAAEAAFQDTDGDGFTDYLEIMTGSAPGLAASTPESFTATIFGPAFGSCFDFADNDLDGAIDGADFGCTDFDGDLIDSAIEASTGSIPIFAGSTPEHTGFDGVVAAYGWPFFPPTCSDLADNDLDFLPDGLDPGCMPLDADGDGLTDISEKTIYFTSPTNPDTDGDTLTDGAEVLGMASPKAALGILFSSPLLVDTDSDGCSDPEEMGAMEAFGGRRDPMNGFDFYDTNADQTIDLFIDIFGVAFLFGTSPGMPYDRGPPYANVWNITGPDGIVDLFNDIFGVAFQFGHDCTAAP